MKVGMAIGISLHAVGRPNEVIEQIARMVQKTGMDHFVAQFSHRGMPYATCERSMRMFAEKIMPVMKNDSFFQGAETGAHA